MNYRPEIDGLRALAVVPVVLFHAGVPGFTGGYVGVDVFFVISGYLITSILLKEMEDGSFSILNFYERRARRILPALFIVLLFSVVTAWHVQLPVDFKFFAQSLVASVLFLANGFFLIKGGDYFAAPLEQAPLLHLWSLAVEEQFYIIFPILLGLVWRFGQRATIAVIGCLFIGSLLASQWATDNFPSFSFYMLPTRAWELLLGAGVAVWLRGVERTAVTQSRVSNAAGMAGLLLIIVPVFVFSNTTPFPGFYALVPTVGAALIIIFAVRGTYANYLLRLSPLVAIGLVSYSAYLWHQPLLAFSRYSSASELSAFAIVLLIVLSFVLATLTYWVVEKPFRKRGLISFKTIALATPVCVMAAVGFGTVAHFNNGFPQRSEMFARLEANVGFSLRCNGNTELTAPCSMAVAPQVAIFGNSLAMHLVQGVHSLFPEKKIVQITQDTCQPRTNDTFASATKQTCKEFVERALETITNEPSITHVIISADFKGIEEPHNRAAFEEVLVRLRHARKEVLIVGPLPSSRENLAKCYLQNSLELRQCDYLRSEVPGEHFVTTGALSEIARPFGVNFVDLTEAVCPSETCLATINGTLVFRDRVHLSIEGSRTVLERLKPEFESFLNNRESSLGKMEAESKA
jgi:peptidoglycan/LPS O-acetylase OafA/YrhL